MVTRFYLMRRKIGSVGRNGETEETAQHQSQTFKVARNCARKRVEGEEVSDWTGPPGPGLSSDRYRTSASDPTCEPLSLARAPGVTGELVAQQREAA